MANALYIGALYSILRTSANIFDQSLALSIRRKSQSAFNINSFDMECVALSRGRRFFGLLWRAKEHSN